MSETQLQKMACAECGEKLDVVRNRYNSLFLSCACKKQSAKVASKIPDSWG